MSLEPMVEYTVVRQKSPLGETDHITIPEINFHCDAIAPTGKYKVTQLPCPKCLDITWFFVIETKNGNKFLSHGTKYISMFCTNCDYSGKYVIDNKDKDPWDSLSKMDLYRTSLDYIKGLNNVDRDKMIINIKKRFDI